LPRSDARPRTPRVIVSLDSMHGPLRYPCDNFHNWHDNVRAIALALEALRKVDRYGVTKRGEQYKGWKALPAPSGEPTTPELAARVIGRTDPDPARILTDSTYAKRIVRAALKKHHPDQGGDAAQFHRVQQARRILSDYHGVSL